MCQKISPDSDPTSATLRPISSFEEDTYGRLDGASLEKKVGVTSCPAVVQVTCCSGRPGPDIFLLWCVIGRFVVAGRAPGGGEGGEKGGCGVMSVIGERAFGVRLRFHTNGERSSHLS